MILLLFWAVLSGAILVGLGFGRAPERIGAVIIAAAALATVAVNQPDDLSARLSIAAINFILLTALTILAMRATRWWLLSPPALSWPPSLFNSPSSWPQARTP